MNITTFATGMSVGLSLIVAIGAQNAFVLRQGLRAQHVFWICAICALSDALLIMLGVTGFARVAALLPWIDPVMRYGGAIFLTWYGAKSFHSAMMSKGALAVTDAEEKETLRVAVLTCLALTWLNPHVYLDTVVLLGTVSTQFEGQKIAFASGAISGSVLFFFALGYGARVLRPIFARPASWRFLEAGIALVMWSIALKLVLDAG